jgi:predicted NUDIX family NTP pyrophosphohydrolase
MNIIKFPEPQKKLSEEEEIEIARRELLAEVRLMEAQGLLDFIEIEQQPGEVIQLFRQDKFEFEQATD